MIYLETNQPLGHFCDGGPRQWQTRNDNTVVFQTQDRDYQPDYTQNLIISSKSHGLSQSPHKISSKYLRNFLSYPVRTHTHTHHTNTHRDRHSHTVTSFLFRGISNYKESCHSHLWQRFLIAIDGIIHQVSHSTATIATRNHDPNVTKAHRHFHCRCLFRRQRGPRGKPYPSIRWHRHPTPNDMTHVKTR